MIEEKILRLKTSGSYLTENDIQEILSNAEKAKKWDNYYEPQYDMRPTYQVLEKTVENIRDIVKNPIYNDIKCHVGKLLFRKLIDVLGGVKNESPNSL